MLKRSLAVAFTLSLLASCGSNPAQQSAAPKKPAPAVDPATAGSISGKVSFQGQRPVPQPIVMDATPSCARAHSKPPVSEEVVVNADGSLRNVFVWVKSGLPEGTWPVPREMAKMTQAGCIYMPHVIGAQAGQEIEFSNDDPTNHNIHPMPQHSPEWNMSQPPRAEKVIRQFPEQDVMVPVKCNVHPWMKAWIGVVAHPYFAVTGEDGTFAIRNLPPGTYTLEAWQEKYGTKQMTFTVGAKGEASAAFVFP